jgi:hypothetical protein
MSASIYQIIDVPELRSLLEEAYNHPQIPCEAEKKAEYWTCHAKIRSTLEFFGKYGGFGDGDFVMNDVRQLRWIRVELTSEKLVRPELIPAVQHELKNFKEACAVLVEDTINEKSTFCVFIENEKARGFCKRLETLHSLGFPENIQ